MFLESRLCQTMEDSYSNNLIIFIYAYFTAPEQGFVWPFSATGNSSLLTIFESVPRPFGPTLYTELLHTMENNGLASKHSPTEHNPSLLGKCTAQLVSANFSW
jgi:hypothetical protein